NNEDITFTPSGEEIEETETETEMTETEENTVADSSGEVDAGSDTSTAEDADSSDSASDDSGSSDEEEASDDEESEVDLMVFNSSGQLVNNVHVRNGVVVDSDGNEVPGCSVNEDGYVVDAYMNIIDPATGELMN
ncbi:MAG: hypothetical protein LUH07_14715, partial [Lachnospiraceae bacterium]|nr:hypothetical protein [Lachnospiraceae bacterium]